MRVIRHVVVGLVALGLLVTSIGWYLSARSETGQPFDSCHFEGDILVLTYSYGANQAIGPRIDTRSRDIVVFLSAEVGDGITPAIGLSGEARFLTFGGPAPVLYPDGEPLPCPPE
jgi:hypothetical protein